MSFQMVEEAGNSLPTFSLAFKTRDESIVPMLHEGNKLEVSFGSKRSDLMSSPLAVMSMQIGRAGDSYRLVTLTGQYSAIPYAQNPSVKIHGPMSSVALMRSIASKHFAFETNVTKEPLDTQRWIQYNISDRAFLTKEWLHADFGSSFPMVGISSDGKFILKDAHVELTKPFKWRFVKSVQDKDRDIVYDADPDLSIQSGLINSMVGYGRDRLVYNLDTGGGSHAIAEAAAFMAQTKKLARHAEVGTKFATVGATSDNVHSNYWSAYQHNLNRLVSMLGVTTTVSFHDTFKPIRVLDHVFYSDVDVASRTAATDYSTGPYFVKRVSRVLAHRKLATMVQLSRESLNEVKLL